MNPLAAFLLGMAPAFTESATPEEQLPIPVGEVIVLMLYLGSVTFVFSAIVQWWLMGRLESKSVWRKTAVVVTMFAVAVVTFFIMGSMLGFAMLGPFLVSPLLGELLFTIPVFYLFGYNVFGRK